MIRFAAWLGRLVRGLLVLVLAIGLVAIVAGLGLAWRLSQGPLDIGWAAHWVESALNAPDAPTRTQIGAAALAWGGFAAGSERGLELRLSDVRLLDREQRTIASVREVEAIVSMGALLTGAVTPRALSATGVDLLLVRTEDGAVTADLGGLPLPEADPADPDPGPTLAEAIAELTRPVQRDGAPAPAGAVQSGVRRLEQLRRVHLADSTFRLHDRALRTTLRLGVGSLDLVRQPEGGVLGAAAATLAVGAAQASLTLEASLAQGGGTELRLAVAPVSATSVQTAVEAALTPENTPPARAADGMDAAVEAVARLTLSPTLLPTAAAMLLQAGGGRVRVASASIGFDSVLVEAEARWASPGWVRPDQVAVKRAKAVLHAPGGAWPTTLTLAAELRGAPGGLIAGTAELTLDHLAFADLASLWPERLGGHVRPWLTENITAGTARDGTAKLAFETTAAFDSIHLVSVDVSLVGEDATIWWLRPAPPIERAQALLTMRRPDLLEIAIPGARQGVLALKDGLVRITGLDVKDQDLTVTADVAGPVPDLLGLLRHPRLRLLDRKPIPMRNPAGAFQGKLSVALPLIQKLDFDDVKINAQGRFSNLRLGGLVAGRDLDRGEVTLDVSSDFLKAAGSATIAGVPAELEVEMDFRAGPPNQVVQRAQATGRATARQLTGAGLDPGGLIDAGAGRFVARYAQRRDTTADLQVTADLRDAALSLAGWRKAVGQPAEASAKVLLRGERMTGIEELRAQGPGMAIEGRAEMVGNRPLSLVLDRIALGPTQATGQVRFPANPGEPIRATLNGSVLDLSSEFGRKPGAPAPPSSDKGTPWVADVRFDRVLLSGQRGLAGVTAHAEFDGRRVTALRAGSTGPERLDATIRTEGATRRVSVTAADGGGLLRGFDVVDTIVGGRLSLQATYDDRAAASPLTGVAELADFHVRNAPALGKLLQAVTIYGVVDALSGPGLAFTQLRMPFRWDGSVLDIMDGEAFSASLGLTGKGRIDAARSTVDMQGTIVPAYVLNSLLGRIPVLGRLFSAERGGGLVAVNYGLRGPLADPSVTVNPLSALTPGFLRGLFSIFD